MKKHYIIFLLSSLWFFTACEKEETLTPSYEDVDRVASQVDLSKPLVKYLYENYQKGLLYEYNDTLDFYYLADTKTVAEKWLNVTVPRVDSQYIDAALTFLDTMIFSYFKEEITVGDNFYSGAEIMYLLPHKMLLAQELYTESSSLFTPVTEADTRSTADIGALHGIGNSHSFVFNTDIPTITSSAAQTNSFGKDIMYLLISQVFEINDLYSSLPDEFYSVSSNVYGQDIGDVYEEEGYEIPANYLVDKDWFYSKGYVDARYFFNKSNGGLSNYEYTQGDSTIYVEKAIFARSSYSFLSDDAVFVRSYLNECIHTTEDAFDKYPEIILTKFKLLTEYLLDLGVDIVEYNPALNILYTEE